jgi:predicted DNA-binding protein with PD1-like motif
MVLLGNGGFIVEVFTGSKIGRVFFIRIDEGDDVAECINKFIEEKKIVNAIVTSAIGTLSAAVVHHIITTDYPSSNNFIRLKDRPIEVNSIDGLIVDGAAHLHMVISEERTVIAGHLEPGCKSLYLFEMAVLEVEGLEVTRKPNQHGKKQLEYK